MGDKLSETDSLINWEAFRPIVRDMYDNKSEKGGRPNIDEIIIIKILVLQEWHGLSDPELERQIEDRISFRKFLGFPEVIPDYSIVWTFRERLSKTGRNKKVWQEFQSTNNYFVFYSDSEERFFTNLFKDNIPKYHVGISA